MMRPILRLLICASSWIESDSKVCRRKSVEAPGEGQKQGRADVDPHDTCKGGVAFIHRPDQHDERQHADEAGNDVTVCP